VGLCVSLIFSTILIIQLFRQPLGGDPVSNAKPELYISLFLPQTESTYFQQIILGAKKAADDHNLGLSVHPIGEQVSDFQFVGYSGVNGIIVYPTMREEIIRGLLYDLRNRDIPVVLIEHSINDADPWPFVGTNNFDLGRRIGEILKTKDQPENRVVVVYSERSPGIWTEKELVEMGIAAVPGLNLSEPVQRRLTGENPLGAEELMSQILRNESEITTLVFTDTDDTLAAVQVLVDLNMVGKVQVVGFGNDEQILDYLATGILTASLVVRPEDIGYSAVNVLNELMRKGFSPGYIDTPVSVLWGRQ
jgi:ribose transport system substrate-binding protein